MSGEVGMTGEATNLAVVEAATHGGDGPHAVAALVGAGVGASGANNVQKEEAMASSLLAFSCNVKGYTHSAEEKEEICILI